MLKNSITNRTSRRLKTAYQCSVAISALLAGAVPVAADQLSVTNGSTINQSGGAFGNVSSSANGAAVYARGNGSTINGSDLILDGGAFKGSVVNATSGGSINLTGNTVIAGGNGLEASGSNSQITMTGGSITSSNSMAVFVYSGASVTLNDVTINDTSRGSGAVQVNSGKFTMDGGSISSVGAALFNQQSVASAEPNLTARDFTVSTTGANGYGLNANIYSNNLLENGLIHTRGERASGIWAAAASGAPLSTVVNGDRLTIWTEGLNAHGVFNEKAIVNLTNTDITVGQAFGLYTQNGGRISLQNGSITVTGAGGSAVLATAPGSVIDVYDAAVSTKADNTRGLYSRDQSVVTAGNSSISVSGRNSYGVFSTSQGTVNLYNTDVAVSGQVSYALVFLGATALNQISVNGGEISSRDSTAIVANGGTDVLSLANASVSGDSLLYAGKYEQSGTIYGADFTLNADHSILQGGAQADEHSTATLNLKNSEWTLSPSSDGTVDSAISVLNIEDSEVRFATPTSETYQTLTIGSGVPETTAVYNATGNARLHLNTYLNEGGPLSNQKTDRLLVNGDVSGTTTVSVSGAAGSPGGGTSLDGQNLASEGISIIQVAGHSAQDAFQLYGGYATLGGLPYQYSLHAYGPGSSNGTADESQRLVIGADPYWDYRLQSVYIDPIDPIDPPGPREVAPQVASYLVAPTALFQAGIVDISNLHGRLGEIRDDRATARDSGTGEAFFRAYGGQYDYTSNLNASSYGYAANIDYAAAQMGGNLYSLDSQGGVTRFGVAGTIGSLSFDPKNVQGTTATNLDTWSASAYATHLDDSGWYVDGIVSYGGFGGDVSTSLRGRTAGLRGNSVAASVEAGYPFHLGDGLVFEPQAQVSYQHLSFDKTIDVDEFPVDLGHQDLVTARIGAKLSKSFAQGQGDQLVSVYAKANLLHGFGSGGRVSLGDSFSLGQFGTTIEGGLGINAMVGKNLSLYGDATYQHRVGNAGASGFTFVGGLRHSF